MTGPRCSSERGVALLLVLIALTVVGGFAGAAFLIALAEQKVGRIHRDYLHAFAAAEAGVYRPLWDWDPAVYNSMPVDGVTSIAGRLDDGTGSYSGTVRRLSELLFVVTAAGADVGSLGRGRVGLVLRLNPLAVNPTAAVTVLGGVAVDGASSVSGRDQSPPGWDCPVPDSILPALRISPRDSAAVSVGCLTPTPTPTPTPSPTPQCLTGDPPILVDSAVTLPNLTTFDGMEFAALEQLASHVVTGVVHPLPRTQGATCVTAVADNWGDPYGSNGPCGDYVPLIYATGDLVVTGGRGQGTLVVAGDLTISGGFTFSGLVLVQGSFTSSGAGNRLMGAVVVANSDLGHNSIAGVTVVQYSSCAIRRARIGAGTPSALRRHGWFQAY